ncbi:hypothetical protein LSTR_LSTR009590 [Laodelphax striatellus]|uniref:Uncharacterized protein n=1 Tax=Laodelphax striatellus TaxID=195883 RepID=A0A482WR39_LAOST|nr:hypothetical protein LSTR_LSTR009590 [Laodelphax striatellus]
MNVAAQIVYTVYDDEADANDVELLVLGCSRSSNVVARLSSREPQRIGVKSHGEESILRVKSIIDYPIVKIDAIFSPTQKLCSAALALAANLFELVRRALSLGSCLMVMSCVYVWGAVDNNAECSAFNFIIALNRRGSHWPNFMPPHIPGLILIESALMAQIAAVSWLLVKT